ARSFSGTPSGPGTSGAATPRKRPWLSASTGWRCQASSASGPPSPSATSPPSGWPDAPASAAWARTSTRTRAKSASSSSLARVEGSAVEEPLDLLRFGGGLQRQHEEDAGLLGREIVGEDRARLLERLAAALEPVVGEHAAVPDARAD